jgi:hypothetical protein
MALLIRASDAAAAAAQAAARHSVWRIAEKRAVRAGRG